MVLFVAGRGHVSTELPLSFSFILLSFSLSCLQEKGRKEIEELALLSLFSLSLGDDTKWPTTVDELLNKNSNKWGLNSPFLESWLLTCICLFISFLHEVMYFQGVMFVRKHLTRNVRNIYWYHVSIKLSSHEPGPVFHPVFRSSELVLKIVLVSFIAPDKKGISEK